MPHSGQGADARVARRLGRADVLGAALGLAIGLVPAAAMWGFAIDDAWIPVRYARHVASGAGYRFDVGGASTDGVTPLPWPWLLAPFARASAEAVLLRAQYINLAAWAVAAAALGVAIARARASASVRAVALLSVGLSLPVAAHVVTGLETGLATSLATLAAVALVARRGRLAASLAGLVASLRPEAIVWALAIGVGAAIAGDRRRRPATVVLAALPFASCALAREIVFGHAAPLAVAAKPSDLAHGLAYAAAATVVAGTPWLVLPSRVAWRGPPAARALVLAFGAHLAAIVAAGGDWMPYGRLVAPFAPSLALAWAVAGGGSSAVGRVLRSLAALTVGLWAMLGPAREGPRAGRDRAALLGAARPVLAGAHRVASLDVGWPTAVTEADMIDLAGLTDPEIAALPGGHTSKHVDAAMLLARDPDLVLLYVAPGSDPTNLDRWRESRFSRGTEIRLASSDLFAEHFEATVFLPLGTRGAGYLVLEKRLE